MSMALPPPYQPEGPALSPALPALTSPGAQWLAETMAPPSIITAAWADSPSHLAEVPLGVRFDVVRVAASIGLPAYDRLVRPTSALGPVLWCGPRSCVEFLVPAGSTEEWDPIRLVTIAGRGAALRCPAPGFSGRGRWWMTAPDGSGILTAPGVLRAHLAHAAARV